MMNQCLMNMFRQPTEMERLENFDVLLLAEIRRGEGVGPLRFRFHAAPIAQMNSFARTP